MFQYHLLTRLSFPLNNLDTFVSGGWLYRLCLFILKNTHFTLWLSHWIISVDLSSCFMTLYSIFVNLLLTPSKEYLKDKYCNSQFYNFYLIIFHHFHFSAEIHFLALLSICSFECLDIFVIMIWSPFVNFNISAI